MADDSQPSSSPPETTDALIRSMLFEQKRVESRHALPELTPQSELDAPSQTVLRRPGRKLQHRARAARTMGSGERQYRLQGRYVLWAALVLIVIFYPMFLTALLLFTLAAALITYLTLGPGRILELYLAIRERLAQRWPGFAARHRAQTEALATRWKALRKWLPEHWAERLALPGLTGGRKAAEPRDNRPDPFEKLKPLQDVYRG